MGAMEYGIVSLLPTALVLILAVITQRTLESVIAGAIFAFLLMDGTGFVDTLAEVSLDVLRDEDIAWIILVCALYGVFIALLVRSGGSMAFGNLLLTRLRSKGQSLFATWVLGLFIFLDDYLNSLTVGATMKAVTDRFQNLSRDACLRDRFNSGTVVSFDTHIELGGLLRRPSGKKCGRRRWARLESFYRIDSLYVLPNYRCACGAVSRSWRYSSTWCYGQSRGAWLRQLVTWAFRWIHPMKWSLVMVARLRFSCLSLRCSFSRFSPVLTCYAGLSPEFW